MQFGWSVPPLYLSSLRTARNRNMSSSSSPASSISHCSPESCITLLAFVDSYSRGDFPADHAPEQPADLGFAPDTTSLTVSQDEGRYDSLQSLATFVQDFFRKYGFL